MRNLRAQRNMRRIGPKVTRHAAHSALLLIGVALALAFLPAAATAAAPPLLWQTPEVGKSGAGAGEFSTETGIAADPASGHFFVADEQNERVAEFDAWGQFVKAWGWNVAPEGAVGDTPDDEFEVCTEVCQAGVAGAGAGQFALPNGVALDASGNVYVEELEREVRLFGEKSLRVQKFAPNGDFVLMIGGKVNKTKVNERENQEANAEPVTVTEAEENLCTAISGDECGAGVPGPGKGQFIGGIFGNKIDTNSEGSAIFVGDVGRIQEFNTSGAFEGEVAVPGEGVKALAVDGQGNFYVTFEDPLAIVKPDVHKFGPGGAELGTLPVKDPGALAVGADDSVYVVERTNGNFSPDTIVKFNSAGNQTITPGEHFAEIPGSFSRVRGLALSTGCDIPGEDLYATHTSVGEGFLRAYGPPPNPATCPPPEVPPTIADQYAVSVDPGGATVQAVINPRFWPDTHYYVQYGTGECSKGGCGKAQPAPPGSLLSTQTINAPLTTAGVFLSGLEPATTYHYRFVAQSGGGGPVRGLGGTLAKDGQEGTFTTFPLPTESNSQCPNQAFRSGASALLPDCRAYEMVSPVNKENGDIVAFTAADHDFAALNQSSANGEKLTYSSYRAFGDAQSAPFTSQYIASRQDGVGWVSHTISPPRGISVVETVFSLNNLFKAFSADLCSAWVIDDTGEVLAPGAVAGFSNLYRREDCGDESYKALTTVTPLHRSPLHYVPQLQGISADGSHVIFRATDSLTADAPVLGEQRDLLYEAFGTGKATKLRFVCLLPNGTAVSAGCSAGTPASLDYGRGASISHAISTDGSRIFWTDAQNFDGRLYVRIAGNETRAVSAAGEALSERKGAHFWTAAADGSAAVYTVGERIGGAADLYEFDLGGEQTRRIAGKVYGLLGASDDASRIYLVSGEALGGNSVAGKPNLYLRGAGGGLSFIATLSGEDARTAVLPSPVNPLPNQHSAQVSADGGHVAFLSTARLTGYDNTDVDSGKADAEVYIYDAEADRLDCASCNPTGARPVGRNLPAGNGVPSGVWGAASIPTAQTALYPMPRVLSADGQRLIFQSTDALVASDTNGAQDVYEWETAGKGDCTEESPAFSKANGGCIALISSGESPVDSLVIDTSPSGEDVFFATAASLLAQDPGLIDIYDARVGGGLPTPAGSPAACEGEACQGPFSPPNDPTPASAAYEGPGNPKPTKKKAHRTKRHQHKSKHGKRRHQRANHDRRAGR